MSLDATTYQIISSDYQGGLYALDLKKQSLVCLPFRLFALEISHLSNEILLDAIQTYAIFQTVVLNEHRWTYP
jgi:hypothetical protein